MWRDGVYAVDAYKSNDVQDTILSILVRTKKKMKGRKKKQLLLLVYHFIYFNYFILF